MKTGEIRQKLHIQSSFIGVIRAISCFILTTAVFIFMLTVDRRRRSGFEEANIGQIWEGGKSVLRQC